MTRKTGTIVMLAAMLGACGDGAATEGAEAGAGARGEVLGGSISDSMIPLDELKSRAPAFKATPAPAASGAGEGEGAGDTAEAAAETDGDAAEQPAADDSEPELPDA